MSLNQTPTAPERRERYKWKLFEYFYMSIFALVTSAFSIGLIVVLHLTGTSLFWSFSTILIGLVALALYAASVSYAILFVNALVERE